MAYTTIDNPGLFFNTLLYAGNGSTQSITGVGFQPDWVWVKCRNNGKHHSVYDSVRGATKYLYMNLNYAEVTDSNSLTSFDSDGFSVGTFGDVNASFNFSSWNWKANGTSTTNPSGGTITTTASVNTTAGFSVFTYTGNGSAAHVAHGLGVAPTVVIIKVRSTTDHWFVKHPGIASNEYLYLNGDSAKVSGANAWSATNPDATKIYIGTDGGVNASGVTYVCYAFAEKQGYSKFGSYTGNGNADGTFVYTGFRPAWVMIKKSSGTNEWGIWDNKRSTFNVTDDIIYANLDNTEATSNANGLDFVSNGFKIRASGDLFNGSSGSYVYMAFAEHPFVTEGTKAAGTAK
jgi:hypothetical protein